MSGAHLAASGEIMVARWDFRRMLYVHGKFACRGGALLAVGPGRQDAQFPPHVLGQENLGVVPIGEGCAREVRVPYLRVTIFFFFCEIHVWRKNEYCSFRSFLP